MIWIHFRSQMDAFQKLEPFILTTIWSASRLCGYDVSYIHVLVGGSWAGVLCGRIHSSSPRHGGHFFWPTSKWNMRDDINGSTLASKAGNRQRITQACEPCRRRKAKCSRHRPVCESCHKLREFCYYRGRIPSRYVFSCGTFRNLSCT